MPIGLVAEVVRDAHEHVETFIAEQVAAGAAVNGLDPTNAERGSGTRHGGADRDGARAQ